MGLNHLQSLICTYSADDLRPLMFPSQVCNMRSSSFRSVLKCECLVHNEYGFFAIFFQALALVTEEVLQHYMEFCPCPVPFKTKYKT